MSDSERSGDPDRMGSAVAATNEKIEERVRLSGGCSIAVVTQEGASHFALVRASGERQTLETRFRLVDFEARTVYGGFFTNDGEARLSFMRVEPEALIKETFRDLQEEKIGAEEATARIMLVLKNTAFSLDDIRDLYDRLQVLPPQEIVQALHEALGGTNFLM